MKIYPEMDKEIIKLLDMEGMPLSVYAARCIEKLQAENSRLTAENAEMRARLENAVELPCKVGDTVYWLSDTMIYEYKVQGFIFDTNDLFGLRLILGEIEPSVIYHKDKKLFFDRAAAEAHLKELQEEEERR